MISIRQQYGKFLQKKSVIITAGMTTILGIAGLVHMAPTHAIPSGYEGQFIITVKTTVKTDSYGTTTGTQYQITKNQSITAPYNYTVDCDINNTGHATQKVLTNQADNAICNYDQPGTYQIAISGEFPAFYAGYDANKLISVDQWGTNKWQTMANAFLNASSMTMPATDTPDLSQVTDMSNMFVNATSFNGDISNWDVSNVENMSYMFADAKAFNQDISNWDVSNVENMGAMFFYSTAFNQDISNWDVSNVEIMAYMFGYATVFNQPLNSWNVSSVMNMGYMFADAKAFNQDISNWDVSNVENMGFMFANAASFDQDLGSWNISGIVANRYGYEMENALSGSGLSHINYDKTLLGWARTAPENIHLGAEGLTYCKTEGRDALINKGWTISGDAKNDSDCTAPIITIPEDISFKQSDEISPITITATDDSGSATITVDGLPEGLHYSENTHQITGTPTETGEFTITVKATDPSGNSTTKTFKINVTAPEAPTEPKVPTEPITPEEAVASQTPEAPATPNTGIASLAANLIAPILGLAALGGSFALFKRLRG